MWSVRQRTSIMSVNCYAWLVNCTSRPRAPFGDGLLWNLIGGAHLLKGKNKQKWEQLCVQAAVEQDSARLMKLIHEITRMLDEKEQRLQREQSASDGV